MSRKDLYIIKMLANPRLSGFSLHPSLLILKSLFFSPNVPRVVVNVPRVVVNVPRVVVNVPL